MPSVKNLSGVRFERLVAMQVSGRDKQNRAIWLCKCDCGVEKSVPSRHLVNGVVRSCGCLAREAAASSGKRGALKLTGAQSHLFKPELTDAQRLSVRNVPELRKWRKAVFERDNYTCDICHQIGGRLNAHHLDCWAEYPDKRYDADNGITLCDDHHRKVHNSVGGFRERCTAEDYYRFKSAICGIWTASSI